MRIGVLQHAFRANAEADADALIEAAKTAVREGAEVLVLPEVESVHAGLMLEEWWQRIAIAVPEVGVLVPHVGQDRRAAAFAAEFEPLGRIAMITGDAAIDPQVIAETVEQDVDVVVLAPRSESELQAEAVLELAIGLSVAVASLVIIAEPDGAQPGDPGHGGSAVIYLGEVMAEAGIGDDMLLCDIEFPLTAPEPVGPLPQAAPILAQRLAAHSGRKLEVPYPADLS